MNSTLSNSWTTSSAGQCPGPASRHWIVHVSIENTVAAILHYNHQPQMSILIHILLSEVAAFSLVFQVLHKTRQEYKFRYFGQCSACHIQWQLDNWDRQHHLYLECCTFISRKLRRKVLQLTEMQRWFHSEPIKREGEDKHNLNDLEEIKVTESYLRLD